MPSATVKKRKGKPPLIVPPPGPDVRRPKGWKPPPPNTRRDKALQRFLDDLLKSKNKGGKVLYKEEGGTLNKYKKDEIKRLKEQIAIQKKAAGPGSERELKSLNTRLNKMQPSIPIPKRKPSRVTNQPSNKSEHYYDESGKPKYLTYHGYKMLKARRKAKRAEKSAVKKLGGGKVYRKLGGKVTNGNDVVRMIYKGDN